MKFQQLWRSVLSDPFIWFYSFFFKTNTFMHEVEIENKAKRLKFLLKLLPAMFLVSYPLSLLLSLLGNTSQFGAYTLLERAAGVLSGFLVAVIWDAITNRPMGILGGTWLGLWLGIWATISLQTWIAVLLATIGGIALGSGVVKSIGKITIENLNENRRFLEDIKERWWSTPESRDLLGNFYEYLGLFVLYLIGGAAPEIEQSRIKSIGVAIATCIAVSTIGFISVLIISSIFPGSIVGLIWWAVTMGGFAGVLAGETLNRTSNRLAVWGVGMGGGIIIGGMLGPFQQLTVATIIVDISPAAVTAIAWCTALITLYSWNTIISKTTMPDRLIFLVGMALGILAGLYGSGWAIFLFAVCYGIAYCQLPISLLSFFSIVTSAKTAHKNPSEVYTQLLASSLYWDKWQVLLLPDPHNIRSTWPGLDEMMESAIGTDLEQAVEILAFIEAERPLQFAKAQSGGRKGFLKLLNREEAELLTLDDIFEITQHFTQLLALASMLDLSASSRWLKLLKRVVQSVVQQDIEQAVEMITLIEKRHSSQLEVARDGLRIGFLKLMTSHLKQKKTLLDISRSTEHLAQLQDISSKLKVTDLDEAFALLNDACLDAAHYLNSLGWRSRYEALQHMIMNFRTVEDLLNAPELNVISAWEGTAQYELDKLRQEPQKTDQINNPYVVGQALQPGTSLFVGRQDLVQQLEQGLGRGSHRSTFFLLGERRMGKSSTLRQLPILLDARHFLPIFFDLQAPEITSSTAAFLNAIAERMSETIEAASMQIETLSSQQLQEAQRENEATVYYVFNLWLKQVEMVLEQNDRIVLLSFDEFENLEPVSKTKALDLHLLLNWFRSIIQNRPQLALLFSGGKSVSELGQETDLNWSGYFVNVQTFRVSFLHEAEARQLITRPIPDYPIEQIFGPGVVDEIIHVTNCHPFLVQAVCSNLVNRLNTDGRDQGEIHDVAIAVMQVLENWEDYFQDLWTRTDSDQRACLMALNELGKGDIQQIAHYIHGNPEITRGTLQSVRNSLQTLLKRDLVSLENKIYQIATPIFSQWVERNS